VAKDMKIINLYIKGKCNLYLCRMPGETSRGNIRAAFVKYHCIQWKAYCSKE